MQTKISSHTGWLHYFIVVLLILRLLTETRVTDKIILECTTKISVTTVNPRNMALMRSLSPLAPVSFRRDLPLIFFRGILWNFDS